MSGTLAVPIPAALTTSTLRRLHQEPLINTSLPTLNVCREHLCQARNNLHQRFLDGDPVQQLVAARAQGVDETVLCVWSESWEFDETVLALVAVGGYGRGELHPGSDIDLLLLLAEPEPDAALQAQIEKFLTALWDIGLEVGHSVRTIAQCASEAAQDITIATNLMEARLLAGSKQLYDAMLIATDAQHIWPIREFFEAKCREQQQRHHKFHDSAYNLEPNIKDGPGGLRDIHTIVWVAMRHFGAANLHGLVAHGFLTEAEYISLREGRDFLWQIRFGLHTLTNRREDRLLFDYQRTLASQFGYQDGNRLAVESFMKHYYRTMQQLQRLNEMLLQLFQEAILFGHREQRIVPINKRFQARNDFIEVTHERTFQTYPFALLEIFLLLAQRPELKGVRAETIRMIRDHCYLIDASFRADLRCRTLFMELLRQPDRIIHALRRMNNYGVLGAYIPVFGAIVGQLQHDLFHVYTVDQHTLFLLSNLRGFARSAPDPELPLCNEVFQRLPKPELLYLAGLFHDIAKGRGGDHSTLGASDALSFCLHHGLSLYDAQLVSWLVQQHLLMSSTAQRKDISDPDIVTSFATLMGDQHRLNYLYLLTVADIRATNTTLWNSWKASLLEELYLSTLRALRRGLEHPIDATERIREMQTRARQLLLQHEIDPGALEALWSDLGDDYFLSHSADELAWHAQGILNARAEELPLILIRESSQRGTEVFVYAHDANYLFAASATSLAQLGFTVLDARIITSQNGYGLNTFIILEESGRDISAHRLQEIALTLHQRLRQPLTESEQNLGQLMQVSRRTRRHIKHFTIPSQVNFTQDPRRQRSILEVIANDRPGLLSAVGKAFIDRSVRLQNARISTFGARVEDVFFITGADNQPITDLHQQAQLRETITDYLQQLG